MNDYTLNRWRLVLGKQSDQSIGFDGTRTEIEMFSDMEELLGMSERLIVLHEGHKTGELERPEFSQEKVLTLASGIA